MIYPTQRAVILTACVAPVALVVGVVSPGGWVFALLWIALIVALVLVDATLIPRIPADRIGIDMPGTVAVGEEFALSPHLAGDTATARFGAALGPPADPVAGGAMRFRATRRGTAPLQRIWARRAGPLGLAWKQASREGDHKVLVIPDLRAVRDQGMKQYLRSTQFGSRIRMEAGDGNEFQALTDFQPGMARRSIDWKASAKHWGLLAREYRTERDNALVFAVDGGRSMCEPVAGVPRIDRAVSAALLSAFVALRSGDRVRLFAFSGRPSADSGDLRGARSFAALNRVAAAIDYAAEESNYTLSLTVLDQRLTRRSIIILFTEFTDPTSAELMLAAARRLTRRHRLVFVLLRDEELETLVAARPDEAQDIVRANVAATLLRERRIVIERLKRAGIDVVEAGIDDMPLALVDRYLQLRERA